MKLADAARANDERTEAGASVDELAAELGRDAAELLHVAEQRALRAVVRHFRGEAALKDMARTGGVALGHTERQALVLYAAMYLDGMAIGLRASQESE